RDHSLQLRLAADGEARGEILVLVERDIGGPGGELVGDDLVGLAERPEDQRDLVADLLDEDAPAREEELELEEVAQAQRLAPAFVERLRGLDVADARDD